MMREKNTDLTPMITHRYAFADCLDAFRDSGRLSGRVKIMVHFPEHNGTGKYKRPGGAAVLDRYFGRPISRQQLPPAMSIGMMLFGGKTGFGGKAHGKGKVYDYLRRMRLNRCRSMTFICTDVVVGRNDRRAKPFTSNQGTLKGGAAAGDRTRKPRSTMLLKGEAMLKCGERKQRLSPAISFISGRNIPCAVQPARA